MKILKDPGELFTQFHFDLLISQFHLFVTTKRLLLAATFIIHICADTTYKIMWQGN